MAVKKFFYPFLSLGLILVFGAAGAPAEMKKPRASEGSANAANRPITAIQVSFKVAAITPQNFYMGEVWTRSIKEAQAADKITVEAKAVGLDSQGNQVAMIPLWKAGDPAMIHISPDQGARVKLVILKAGRSNVTVSFGGITKKLPLRAWYDEDKIMHVEITQ